MVYVGTYTGTNSRGIYANQFDSNTGAIAQMGLAAETEKPSFLAIHPSGRYLYAVNEVEHFQGEPSGAISAFAIDFGSRKLRLLNQIASLGAGPAHISLDLNGRHAFVANYGAGNVAVFALEQDGRFGKSTALVQHCGSGLDLDGRPRFRVAFQRWEILIVANGKKWLGSSGPYSSVKVPPVADARDAS